MKTWYKKLGLKNSQKNQGSKSLPLLVKTTVNKDLTIFNFENFLFAS